jgi:hypothetical protein
MVATPVVAAIYSEKVTSTVVAELIKTELSLISPAPTPTDGSTATLTRQPPAEAAATATIEAASEAVLTATADVSSTVVLAAGGYTLTVEGLSAGGSVTLTPGSVFTEMHVPEGTQFVLSLAPNASVSASSSVTLTVQAPCIDRLSALVWLVTPDMWVPMSPDVSVDSGMALYVLDAEQMYAIVPPAAGSRTFSTCVRS